MYLFESCRKLCDLLSTQIIEQPVDIESDQLRLKSFLGNTSDFWPEALLHISDFRVDLQVAIEHAKRNRIQYVQFKR